jgi:hypothetical protein
MAPTPEIRYHIAADCKNIGRSWHKLTATIIHHKISICEYQLIIKSALEHEMDTGIDQLNNNIQ